MQMYENILYHIRLHTACISGNNNINQKCLNYLTLKKKVYGCM